MTALLLSGGIDSVAIAYWCRPPLAITIDYGQSAVKAELRAAATICRQLSIVHNVITADCSCVGVGCMLDRDSARASCALDAPTPEWWPFRNQLLVTLAAARAVTLGFHELLIGTVASDKRHRDGTSVFIESMSSLLSMQEGGMTLRAPAINLTTNELVARSGIPLSLLAWSHSCHTGNYACGTCPGCLKNQQAWLDLRQQDPERD